MFETKSQWPHIATLNCLCLGFFCSVDEIYHLASPASPPHYMYNPIKTIKTNTVGTINMLGMMLNFICKTLFKPVMYRKLIGYIISVTTRIDIVWWSI